MSAQTAAASTFCILVGVLVVMALFDGRDWQLQLWVWSRRLQANPDVVTAHVRAKLSADSGPEAIFLHQIEAAGDDNLAAATLHAGLASMYEASGRDQNALQHYELARDSAAKAAKHAAPASRAGNAIIAVSKEKEALDEARLTLGRAYLKRNRPKDAERELQAILNDPTFVGLETLQLAETLRELGRVNVALKRPRDALRYYDMAKSRVENSADQDVAAWEILHGIREDEGVARTMPQQQMPRLRGRAKAAAASQLKSDAEPAPPIAAAASQLKSDAEPAPPKAAAASQLKSDAEPAPPRQAPRTPEIRTAVAARVEELLEQGDAKQAEELCLQALASAKESSSDAIQVRLLLGSVLNRQGHAREARKHFVVALTAALSASPPRETDLEVASSAYDGLAEAQLLLRKEGTAESELAVHAIFREAQRIAYDASAPMSEARREGEQLLRSNSEQPSTPTAPAKPAAAKPAATPAKPVLALPLEFNVF